VAVATLNDTEHAVGHEGITPECPISCLGVRTVADLLRLLAEATRVSGLQSRCAAVPEERPHEHERVTLDCPITCLSLARHVLSALRLHRGPSQMVGDVLRLLQNHELGEVRSIGPRRVGEVRTALITAGFSASRYPALRTDGA
jgi:hypothetical protein